MAKQPNKRKPWKNPPQESMVLLKKELRRRGLTDSEIESTLRKKRRRKVLEFNVVKSPHMLPIEINSPRRTTGELCTVHFAAERLKLHPKTVLRFIREGRLRASRIGKSYRILRADLDTFAGLPGAADTSSEEPWVTSIIDVPGVGPELAQKWARTIPAALHSRLGNGPSLRAEIVYEAERAHLKIVLLGAPGDTATMLGLIRTWLDQSKRR